MTILEELEYEIAIAIATEIGANISFCEEGDIKCVNRQIILHQAQKNLSNDEIESIRKEIQEKQLLNAEKEMQKLLKKNQINTINIKEQN